MSTKKKVSVTEKLGTWARIASAAVTVFQFVRNTAIVAFFLRYWWLLLLVVLASLLIFSDVLFKAVGMLVYLPVLVLGSMSVALLLRNVFNSETSDDDADTGRFTAEWKKLDPKTRVILTVVQILVYYTGACWIASALMK